MSDQVEVRRDSLGRRIHTGPRGPVPGVGRGGRTNTGMLQARVPPELLEQVDMMAAQRPRQGSTRMRGRTWVVNEALELLFQGDAVRWKRKYEIEKARRLDAERRLQRAREALG